MKRRRRYNLIPPPLGPGEVGPVIECVSDRELAGEPLPPPIQLIPWGPPHEPILESEDRESPPAAERSAPNG